MSNEKDFPVKPVDLTLSKEINFYLKLMEENKLYLSRWGISREHLGTPVCTSITTQKILSNDKEV